MATPDPKYPTPEEAAFIEQMAATTEADNAASGSPADPADPADPVAQVRAMYEADASRQYVDGGEPPKFAPRRKHQAAAEAAQAAEDAQAAEAAQATADAEAADDPLPAAPPGPDITESDRIGFRQAMLGGQLFSKSFPLFGDGGEVVFRDTTSRETGLFAQKLFEISQDDSLSQVGRRERGLQVTTALALVSCSLQGEVLLQQTEPVKTMDQLEARVDQVQAQCFAERSGLFYTTVSDALRSFLDLVTALQAKALDPDFWKTGSSIT